MKIVENCFNLLLSKLESCKLKLDQVQNLDKKYPSQMNSIRTAIMAIIANIDSIKQAFLLKNNTQQSENDGFEPVYVRRDNNQQCKTNSIGVQPQQGFEPLQQFLGTHEQHKPKYKINSRILASLVQEKKATIINILELTKYIANGDQLPQCVIDLEDLIDGSGRGIMQLQCGHYFHEDCLDNAFQVKQICPIDNQIYGTLFGDQPIQGKMEHQIIKQKCQSYRCDTICINYEFPDGTQNGVRYYGTRRLAYLPNNPEGKEILDLLKIAFQRRLIFTVGTSITTGQQDCVIWNGIHHKTSLDGGPTRYGYPDPTYFTRVKEELAAKGVFN